MKPRPTAPIEPTPDTPSVADKEPGNAFAGEITRGDLKLFRQAARQRWPITEEMRRLAVRRIFELLNNPKTPRGLVDKAARTLGLFDRLNLDEIQLVEGTTSTLNVHVDGQVDHQVTVQQVVEQMREDPRFLEVAYGLLVEGQASEPSGDDNDLDDGGPDQ